MPNYPYKDKPRPKSEHKTGSYQTGGSSKLGTHKRPLVLSVQSKDREQELRLLCEKNSWAFTISVKAEEEENIADLMILQNKPNTVSVTKTVGRNDPCHCGSTKKYKKCCALK